MLTLPENDYDWNSAFSFAGQPDPVPPGSRVTCGGFSQPDVVEVLYLAEGQNDGDSWLGVFRLRDGRFARLSAWCDYTGWG